MKNAKHTKRILSLILSVSVIASSLIAVMLPISATEPENSQAKVDIIEDFESYDSIEDFSKPIPGGTKSRWDLPDDGYFKAELLKDGDAISGSRSLKISWKNLDGGEWARLMTSAEKLGKTLKYSNLLMSVRSSADIKYNIRIMDGNGVQYWPVQILPGSDEVQTFSAPLTDMIGGGDVVFDAFDDPNTIYDFILEDGVVCSEKDRAEGYLIIDDIRTAEYTAVDMFEDFEEYDTVEDLTKPIAGGTKSKWDLPYSETGAIKTELLKDGDAISGNRSLKISWENMTWDDYTALMTTLEKSGKQLKYQHLRAKIKSDSHYKYDFRLADEAGKIYWPSFDLWPSSHVQELGLPFKISNGETVFNGFGENFYRLDICITPYNLPDETLASGYIILDDIRTVSFDPAEESPKEPTATDIMEDFEGYADIDAVWDNWDLPFTDDGRIKTELVTGADAIGGNKSLKISWKNINDDDWCELKTTAEKLGKTLKYDNLQMSVKSPVKYYYEFSMWDNYAGSPQYWPGAELDGSSDVQTFTVSLNGLESNGQTFNGIGEWAAGFKLCITKGSVKDEAYLAEGYFILDDIRTASYDEDDNPGGGDNPGGDGGDEEEGEWGNPIPSAPDMLGDFENITDVKALYYNKGTPWDIPGTWTAGSLQSELATGSEALSGDQSLKLFWNSLNGSDWDSLKFYFERAGKAVNKNAVSLTIRAGQNTNLDFAIYEIDNGNVTDVGQCWQHVTIAAGETKTIVLPWQDFMSDTVGRLTQSMIDKMVKGNFAFKLSTSMDMIGNDETALSKPGYLIIDDVKLVDYVSPDESKPPVEAKPLGNGQYVNEDFEALDDTAFEERFGAAKPDGTGMISLDKSGAANGKNSLKWEFDFSGKDAFSSAFSFVPGAMKGDGLLLEAKVPMDMNLIIRLEDDSRYLVYTLPVKGSEALQLLSCEWTDFTEAKGTFSELNKAKTRMTVTLARPDGVDRDEYVGEAYLDDIGYFVYDEITNLNPTTPTNPENPNGGKLPTAGDTSAVLTAILFAAGAALVLISSKKAIKANK